MNRKRRTLCHEMIVAASAEKIFPLLCPVREYEWIPQWRCEMIYSESGIAELGCVFATDFNDEFGREIWVVSCYKPGQRISFVRTGLKRSTRYDIVLKEEGAGTSLSWMQEITGFDGEVEALLEKEIQQRFAAQMNHLEALLKQHLAPGKEQM